MNTLFATLLLALNVADCLLTDAVIRHGGHESNPVMAFLMARPLTAPFRWAIKLAVAVGLAWLCWGLPWLLGLACLPFAYAVFHNSRVLLRQIKFVP